MGVDKVCEIEAKGKDFKKGRNEQKQDQKMVKFH